MASRRYVKRVWRVPKERGPVPYLAALVTKALVKHGWPARYKLDPGNAGVSILYDKSHDLPDDFAEAVSIAVRIVARTYRIDVSEHAGHIILNRPYRVGAGGHFVELRE